MKINSLIRFALGLFMIVILLTAAGCALPGSVPDGTIMPQKTAESGMTGSEPAVFPSETPSPTDIPLPTESPTPEPTFTPSPTFGPTPTATLGPDFFHGSLWYEPEYVSQEGLRYNGRTINTGCTAASVQMVLDFWHAYKDGYAAISAQTLIDRNVRQYQFDPSSGLNIMNTEDDLAELGYYLGVRQNSSKEELLAALERYGPLLVLTKVNWTPFGANHMAVVTGYKPEEDLIRLLDPWQVGGIMEFPYENFDGIWSLNYLEDENDILCRTFFFIVPFGELSPENAPFVPYAVLRGLQ